MVVSSTTTTQEVAVNGTVRHKVGIAVLAAVGIGGLGIGTATAQSSSPSSPANGASHGPAPSTGRATTATAGATGPETERQEVGDNNGPDNAADEIGPERPETGAEKAETGPETPEADSSNHEDPNGVNVDYTPAGQTPETGSPSLR